MDSTDAAAYTTIGAVVVLCGMFTFVAKGLRWASVAGVERRDY
jgi:hypothetical protein